MGAEEKGRDSKALRENGAALPGRAIGVLVPDPDVWLKSLGRQGPVGAIAFSRDGFYYRWLHVPAIPPEAGRSLRLQMESGELQEFRDVVIATRDNLHLSNYIPGEYALVELNVNGGRGSPTQADRFVATELTLIEGTQHYPLRTQAVLREIVARCRVAPTSPYSELREQSQILVTWMSQGHHLRVLCRTEIINKQDLQRGFGIIPQADIGPVEQSPGILYGLVRGTLHEQMFEASATGEIVASYPHFKQDFEYQLPPPGSMELKR